MLREQKEQIQFNSLCGWQFAMIDNLEPQKIPLSLLLNRTVASILQEDISFRIFNCLHFTHIHLGESLKKLLLGAFSPSNIRPTLLW